MKNEQSSPSDDAHKDTSFFVGYYEKAQQPVQKPQVVNDYNPITNGLFIDESAKQSSAPAS